MPLKEIPICIRCGRKLKNPEAKERGMGEVCWKKHLSEGGHKKLISTLQSEKKPV